MQFCLCQHLFAFKEFCMETRLCNISRTTNATDFVKTILESSHNLPKVANLYFLQSSQQCLKMCQESICQYNTVGNKNCFKIFKNCLFRRRFFSKREKLKYPIFMEFQIWTKVCYIRKIQISHEHISQDTATQSGNFFQHFYFFLS